MPEISERPTALPLIRANPEPYGGRETWLLNLSRLEIAQAAEKGRDTTIAKYPHLTEQITRSYELFYDILILPDDARAIGNRTAHLEAAKAQHMLSHYIWYGQQEGAPEGYVNAIFKLLKTTETLLFDPRSRLRKETQTPRFFWAAVRAEEAVISAAAELGLTVFLPDYEQPFDPRREWSHEVTQLDLESGVDFIVIEQGKVRPKAIGIDVKARASDPNQKIPTFHEHWASDTLNPLLNRVLRQRSVGYYEEVVIVIPSAAYLPFSHLADPKDAKGIREYVRDWGKLRPEAKSVMLEGLKAIIEE